MATRPTALAIFALAAACAAPALAQDAQPEAAAVPQESVWLIEPPAPVNLPLVSYTIAAGTPVTIAIDADLSSNSAHQGQKFPIRLVVPVLVDGVEVLPAGTMGEGEVLDADKNGHRGRAGVLILVARHLVHESRLIPLAAVEVGGKGKGHKTEATLVGLSSLAMPIPLGFLGALIKGDKREIAAGTLVEAAIAEETLIVRETLRDSGRPSGGAEPEVGADPA